MKIEYYKQVEKVINKAKDLEPQINLIFFEGNSIVSKLIKWFTRSSFSHVGFFLYDKYLIEAWANTRSFFNSIFGIFGACWQLTTFDYHEKGSKYAILSEKVKKSIYLNYLLLLEFIAKARLPYDFKELLKFLTRRKEELSNGKFICSSGVSFILSFLKIFPEIPYYRQSPQDVYEIALANGFKVTKEGKVK